MRILTAEEMRRADALTIERGIPGLILMETAAAAVVAFLEQRFEPLAAERIAILCGKGNNGGDGFAIARQIKVKHPGADVMVFAVAPDQLKGDAAANYAMWLAVGGSVEAEITPAMRQATIIVDALLGTGLEGPAREPFARLIEEVNLGFDGAAIVSVDIPSGMRSDVGESGDCVRADYTVTFTAPKLGQVLPPNCEFCGELVTIPIGTSAEILAECSEPRFLSEPAEFSALFAPRALDSNKGSYGHVLVIGGAPGKTGAAEMSGVAALRAGAGLVSVATPEPVALRTLELMTGRLDDPAVFERKTLIAMGPGLGSETREVEFARRVFAEAKVPMVVDADALNALAGRDWRGSGALRVLTPHPGEMSRLSGGSVEEVQRDRVNAAVSLAKERNVAAVLKGYRTVIAWPDGELWVNPTGGPALAKGGSGDVLTGLIAGLLAQFPDDPKRAVAAAVWLHGRAGDLAAAAAHENIVLATDLFAQLPHAMEECASV
jgi:NAD(P)H-hydrate epimerase